MVGEPSPSPLFPSRAGAKLDAALDRFACPVAGRRCLDAGASTGGFTGCLLSRGASEVTAVDVGYGLLHETLRNDRRVRILERTNIRSLVGPDGGPAAGFETFEVVVGDLSFVSLTSLAGTLAGDLAAPGASVVLLVKPQFEADEAVVSRGRGIVTDPAIWQNSLERVARSLMSHGACIMEAMTSPIRGTKGNVEFFLHATAHATAHPSGRAGWEARIAHSVEEAVTRFGGDSVAGSASTAGAPGGER